VVNQLLLDTHIIIWLTTTPERVPAHIRKLVSSAERRYVSVVSFIEVALKHRKDAAAFPFTVELLTKAASELHALELPLRSNHTVRIERLPMRHRDPFDHLLMAQAIEEQLPLVTMDADIAAYTEDGLTVIGKT
jgi:PIN domain nuclease of toxin-antitoxin system